MKTVKFRGTPPGPTITTLSEVYDFTSGVCDMTDTDANTLLIKCGRSYEEIEPSIAALVQTRVLADGTVAPVLASAVIVGKTITLKYTEDMSLKPTTVVGDYTVTVAGAPVAVSRIKHGANTITLTLASAAEAGDEILISYDNTTVYDTNGNAAVALVEQAVTNNTIDVTAPVLATATVNGANLVLTYTEKTALHETKKAVPADYAVLVGETPNDVVSVTVNGSAKTVTLVLTDAITFGQVVTLGYTKSAHATAYIQDTIGLAAANLVDQAVTNNTPE